MSLSLRVLYIISYSPFMRGPTSRIGEGKPNTFPSGSTIELTGSGPKGLRSGSAPCYASPILQILFDLLLVFGYVNAAWLFTALSTFQVVGGIDALASWAGIVFPNFLQPLFIANRFDSFKIDPKLDPMRHCRL